MIRLFVSFLVLLMIPALGLMLLQAETSTTSRQASDDVVEVFGRHCYSCHNEVLPKGGFSLQTYEALMRGGKNGSAIVPGDSDESRLVQMVEGMIEPIMPEDGLLFDEEVQIIRAWIDAGAPPWDQDLARRRLEVPDIAPLQDQAPRITSLAFHPAGDYLATGTFGEVQLLRVPDRVVEARLEGHEQDVRALAFSPDGKLLAAAGGPPGRYGEIQIWDLETRNLLQKIQGHTDCIYSAAFSPDGSVLATAGYDRTIRLWEPRSGQELKELRDHIDAVFSIAFSPDGTRLASASADRTVKIWDAISGERLLTLGEATDALQAVTFHPGGALVAAGGIDRRIRIWQLGALDARMVRSTFAHQGAVLGLQFHPDGERLVSAGADRMIKIWDISELQEREVLEAQPDWVLALSVSPDGRWMATGRYDGSIGFYEVDSNGNLDIR